MSSSASDDPPAAILATDDSAGWNVHDLYRGIGCVDALAAWSASAANFDAKVLGLQFEIDLLGFWKHGHRCGGSVNATLRFGGGHALHAMDATLVAQLPKNGFARDFENRFLETAKLGRA